MIDQTQSAECMERTIRQSLVLALEVAQMDLPVEYQHILRPHIERALDMNKRMPKPTLWQRLQLWIKSEVRDVSSN